MTKKHCPLGEDCDLTIAWMKGAEDARDKSKARIEVLEAQHANDCEEIAKWREIFSGRTISENFEVVWRERLKRSEDREAILEDKLAKAVEALEHAKLNMPHPDQMIDHTLAELKGDKR